MSELIERLREIALRLNGVDWEYLDRGIRALEDDLKTVTKAHHDAVAIANHNIVRAEKAEAENAELKDKLRLERGWEAAFKDAEKDHDANSKKMLEFKARAEEAEAERKVAERYIGGVMWRHYQEELAKLREAKP